MLKMVLSGYESQIKKGFSLDINFLIIVVIVIYFKSKLLFLGIPYLLGEILHKNCDMKNNKVFYLCPLSLNDRKKYLETSILMNLLIPTVLFFMLGIFLLIDNCIDIFIFISVFISMIMFLICRNLDITMYQYNNHKINLYGMSIIASNWIGILNLLFVISNNIYLEDFKISFLALLFLQICVFIPVVRCWKEVLETLINGERIF